MSKLSKSLVIDGIACSEAIDSSGEILDLKGLDISDFENGLGVLNYEHRGDQADGASANDILGAITYAKKIFGPEDCGNDRELGYWNQVHLPFLYIQAELFDGEDHPGAKAAAALIRYYHKRKLPILARYSIEGSTLDREGNVLKRAIAKRVAYTCKPCNRSCISGVLTDSETPKDEKEKEKDVLAELKTKFTKSANAFSGYEGEFPSLIVSDPVDQLSDAIQGLREINDLNKALSAGSFNAAPTSLTGGSALQSETFDRAKKLKNQTMAAYRDWRGKGSLTKFLKHRLPDASDEFLEHFAKLVDDYHLKKFAELEDNLYKAVTARSKAPSPKPAAKAPAPVMKPTARPRTKVAQMPTVEEHDVEQLEVPLTVQGVPVPMPTTPVKEPYFDHQQGALVTPRGIFHVSHAGRLHPHLQAKLAESNPNYDPHAAYADALSRVRGSHQAAMKNWMPLNDRFVKGQIHPAQVSYGVVFGLNSPGIKVPMQEFQFSHFVDAVRARGLDHVSNAKELEPVFEQFMARNRTMPTHAREYFENMLRENGNKANAIRGSRSGELIGFNKANVFRQAFETYLQHHHQGLMDAVKGGGGDGNRVASLLTEVPGFAHKLASYTALLMGAGNNIVTDTHNIRSNFGLMPDDPNSRAGTSPDTATSKYLKSVLMNNNTPKTTARTHQLLQDLGTYWHHNHPAVKAVLNDPVLGPHFKGREEQAVGPAFWWDWSAIPHHEAALGMPAAKAYNEGTDHRPYFDAINPFNKNETSEHDENLPMRLAMLHNKWVEEYGETKALLLYFQYIVPQLLRHINAMESPVHKMMVLADDLKKAANDLTALPELATTPANAQHFQGQHVAPGEVEVLSGPYKGSKMHMVGRDSNQVYVRPQGEAKTMALPLDLEGTGFRINTQPQPLNLPQMVDANVHGHPVAAHQAQRLLMHGIDMASRSEHVSYLDSLSARKRGDMTGWYQNGSGAQGLVKPHLNDFFPQHGGFTMPHREVAFHNLARDFFGLGAHVPTTAMFSHPGTGEPVSVQARVPSAFHFEDDGSADNGLHTLYNHGTLDKLALMDMAMGNPDRHGGNYMNTEQAPFVHLIDNGLAFQNDTSAAIPQYKSDHSFISSGDDMGHMNTPLHHEAFKWLTGLKPEEFGRQQLAQGATPEIAKLGQHRLMALQQAAISHPEGPTFQHLKDAIDRRVTQGAQSKSTTQDNS